MYGEYYRMVSITGMSDEMACSCSGVMAKKKPWTVQPFRSEGCVRLVSRRAQNTKPEQLILGPIQTGHLGFVPIIFHTRGVVNPTQPVVFDL